MSNVLGDLFQEIADAIRTKTGGADKMAPASFPDEILAIATVINGGGTGEGNLKISSGMFVTDSGNNVRKTVAHGLGEMPDFVFVYFASGTQFELADSAIHLVSAVGMNSKFTALGSGSGYKGSYSVHGCYASETDGVASNYVYGTNNVTAYGMDEIPDTTNFDYNAWIATPDAATFEVGANTVNTFWPGGTYGWIALSGIGATSENAEDLSF